MSECLHCGGYVNPRAKAGTHDGQKKLADGWVCSTICHDQVQPPETSDAVD